MPEQGDWYARNMYIQGTAQYKYHVKTYGHPSKFGYKDMCHLWRAERWDPEGLIKMYKGAGAEYFVAIANTTTISIVGTRSISRGTACNVGPKRDIVGTWAKPARAHGLKIRRELSRDAASRLGRVPSRSLQDRYSGPLSGRPYDGVDRCGRQG